MSDGGPRTSALSRLPFGEETLLRSFVSNITVEALAGRAVYRLEIRNRESLGAACTRIFGWLPPTINQRAGHHGLQCLGVAPAAWLFSSAEDGDGGLWRNCRDLAAATDGALVDVSHGYCVLRLAGEGARALLARLCPVDVRPAAFAPGRCLSSNLEGHRVLIDAQDDGLAFELFIERSYSLSFWACLIDAATVLGEADK